MTLREIHLNNPRPKTFLYSDEDQVGMFVLARPFGLSAALMKQFLREKNIKITTERSGTNKERVVGVGEFPNIVRLIQSEKPELLKASSRTVDTTKNFRVTTLRGVVWEYKYPKK